MAIVPAVTQICLIGDDDEVAAMLDAPLVKAIILLLTAEELRKFGYEHPMGPHWRGVQDFDPVRLSREKIVAFCDQVDTRGDPGRLPVRHAETGGARGEGILRRRHASASR